MSTSPNIENTHPSTVINPSQSPRVRRWPWIILGIVMVLLIAFVSGLNGYREGIDQRLSLQKNQITEKAAEQFNLGLADLEARRYEFARQRFEYVIQIDPSFPGVAEKLAETIVGMSILATPTLEPSATEIIPTQPILTPTPDTRNEEQLFAQIKQFLTDKQWTKAIDTIEALRKVNIKYHSVEVDGFYYGALRNRGVQRILVLGSLEPGMYDLALAERFGPLDADADSYRIWARLYVTGASFWKIDWEQVVNYFSEIYLSLPNLRDGSGKTAVDRFREASIELANKLISKGEYCKAQDHYAAVIKIGRDNALIPTATAVADGCVRSKLPPTDVPAAATPTPTETATGTLVTPIGATETPTHTQPAPVATPTPTHTQPPPPATPTHTNTPVSVTAPSQTPSPIP
jgi:tetratricopeptide (TPR) repeat protein